MRHPSSEMFAFENPSRRPHDLASSAKQYATFYQTVMSTLPYLESSTKIGISGDVRRRSFALGCGVLLVIYWSSLNLPMEERGGSNQTPSLTTQSIASRSPRKIPC
jgi:hypothetical protein